MNKVKIGQIVKGSDCIIGQYYKNVEKFESYGPVIKDRNTIFICISRHHFKIIKTNDKLSTFHTNYEYSYHIDTFKRVRKPKL